MRVTIVKKLMLAGLSINTNIENEKNEETAKIPQLWDDYQTQGIYSKTFNKNLNSSLYAVFSDYENENKEDFKVTVAVEVKKPKNAMIIEDKRYLVFDKKGDILEIVDETWNDINEYFENNSDYTRKYDMDFEKYHREDEVEIYISIH